MGALPGSRHLCDGFESGAVRCLSRVLPHRSGCFPLEKCQGLWGFSDEVHKEGYGGPEVISPEVEPARGAGGGRASRPDSTNMSFQSPVLIDHLFQSGSSCPWRWGTGLFLLAKTNRFPVALRLEGTSSPPQILLLPLALGQF